MLIQSQMKIKGEVKMMTMNQKMGGERRKAKSVELDLKGKKTKNAKRRKRMIVAM